MGKEQIWCLIQDLLNNNVYILPHSVTDSPNSDLALLGCPRIFPQRILREEITWSLSLFALLIESSLGPIGPWDSSTCLNTLSTTGLEEPRETYRLKETWLLDHCFPLDLPNSKRCVFSLFCSISQIMSYFSPSHISWAGRNQNKYKKEWWLEIHVHLKADMCFPLMVPLMLIWSEQSRKFHSFTHPLILLDYI